MISLVGIYRIVNIITGESYVGQSKDIEKRWAEHDTMLQKGQHHSSKLQRAYDRYGAKAFIKTVLKIYPYYNKFTLDKDETMFIQMFNSYHRGYNMKPTP